MEEDLQNTNANANTNTDEQQSNQETNKQAAQSTEG